MADNQRATTRNLPNQERNGPMDNSHGATGPIARSAATDPTVRKKNPETKAAERRQLLSNK